MSHAYRQSSLGGLQKVDKEYCIMRK